MVKTSIVIGVFDSGVGGELVAEKIRQALPRATVTFKADSEFFPYGNKSQRFILNRSVAMTQKLVEAGCQLIVVGCNAATTNTINVLRQKFPALTFVGIEPPVKPTVKLSRTHKVGIMGTVATINSRRYRELKNLYGKKSIVYDVACPGLAEAIETIIRSQNVSSIPFPERQPLDVPVQEFLDPFIARGVDVVGLGCTHYPYLLPQLKKLYPHVTFYDPADAVVRQVKRLVQESPPFNHKRKTSKQ